MRKRILCGRLSVVCTLVFSLAGPAHAQSAAIPVQVQGTVQNSGTPLTGNHAVTFRIYDAPTAGNLLWQENHPAVSFVGGVYSVSLGQITPLTNIFVSENDDRWLGVQIGTDPEFTPRQPLNATPYANYAVSAGNAAMLGNQPASSFTTTATAVQNTVEPLVILRGIIDSAGSTIAGQGFSSASPGTGVYNISLNSQQYFGTLPSVTALPTDNSTVLAVTASGTSGFTITAADRMSGTFRNAGFHFMALGPRVQGSSTTDADGDGITIGDGDCNDSDPDMYPGNAEICDGKDNDCNGVIDDNVVGAPTWYPDRDADGYGDAAPGVGIAACLQPAGYVASSTDCDDANPGVNPAATEECDALDNDCDGGIDNGLGPLVTYYLDMDNDGYGIPGTTVMSCSPPAGYASVSGDCNDADPGVNPGAFETCGNGIDNDCDGVIDEDCP